MTMSDVQTPTTAAQALAPPAGDGDGQPASDRDTFAPFGEDGFTFADLLDVVNPLQHIPIIGTVYRELTGDALSPAARLAGGTLFGGAIGAVIAGINIAVEDASGKDVGEQVIALFSGDAAKEAPATAVAAAEPKATADADATTPPVPDLALLGPLPAVPAGPTPAPAVQTAAIPQAPTPQPEPPEASASAIVPPVVDLAALAPLAAPTTDQKPETAPPAATVAAATATPSAPAAETPAATVKMAARSPARRPIDLMPPGATAVDGGWFTQTMLSALEKYQRASRLAEDGAETAAVTVSN